MGLITVSVTKYGYKQRRSIMTANNKVFYWERKQARRAEQKALGARRDGSQESVPAPAPAAAVTKKVTKKPKASKKTKTA
jgi:hypothetical protein